MDSVGKQTSEERDFFTPSALPGESPVPLLSGEEVLEVVHDVTLLHTDQGPTQGTLTLTSYKFVFHAVDKEVPQLNCDAPLCCVNSVEKIGGASSKGDHAYGVEVVMKDIRSFRFAFKQEGHSRRVFYDALVNAAFPLSNGKKLFAYPFKASLPAGTYDMDGWKIFDMRAELERIGVPGGGWRISTVNDSYQFCSTYPSVLAVPETTGDEQLELAGVFRSRARLPVLSWLHPKNQSSLSRAAQPLVGSLGKRNKDDEQYLAEIAKANPHTERYVILDARPRRNAIANKALGGGYEDEENYPNAELVFLDIGNIHVMRDSLRKVRDLCYPTIEDTHWMSNLESTHWLDHLRLLLSGACLIADLMDHQRTSILVHCSDGWDRTSQLTSLAMLLMDPYYRTVTGFGVLVEKEWLAFGHKFQQRIGHGDKHAGDEQRSPIFVQFIDAVWQLTNQYPCAFEFNEQFLLSILDHMHSCLFGTFLCNSEKERLEVRDATESLWSHLAKTRDENVNPLYDGLQYNRLLYPLVTIRQLELWPGYYTRFLGSMRAQDSIFEQSTDLYQMCTHLQRRISAMKSELDDPSPR